MGSIGLDILCILFICFKFCLGNTSLPLNQPVKPNKLCVNSLDRLNIELQNSYTCSDVNFVDELWSHLPTDIEELTILRSYVDDAELKEATKAYKSLQTVVLRNSFMGITALKWIQSLPKLTTLELIESSTTHVISHADSYSYGNITAIDLKLANFQHLKKLNISGCNISNIDVSDVAVSTIPDLILSGNTFECGNNFTWLINLHERGKQRVDLNNTKCFMKKVNENVQYPMIYSFTGKPLLLVLHYKREAAYNCPSKCVCELLGMLTITRIQLMVDCIGLNMTKLPEIIPHGTSRCNFSYNLIEDLTPLYTNHHYNNVSLIGLSHNQISYLDPIKFSKLMRERYDFGIWLDHNQLKKFPAEQINKVHADAKEARFMPQYLLGHNPYICSCDYIGHFQDFLYQQISLIHDTRFIQCSGDDPFNPNEKVLTLDVGTLCSTEPLFDSLDLLNLVLSLILLILIIDFAHNYYQYKKNRKLPWIVTKIKFC